MISTRPYLLRAFYEWIIDNELTPYILVDAAAPGAEVPQDYIEDGKIIFNLSPQAIRDLHISNRQVEFDANFSLSGENKNVWVRIPISAVLAIYTRENGRGLVFEEDGLEHRSPPSTDDRISSKAIYSKEPRKPKLTIVDEPDE